MRLEALLTRMMDWVESMGILTSISSMQVGGFQLLVHENSSNEIEWRIGKFTERDMPDCSTRNFEERGFTIGIGGCVDYSLAWYR